MSKIIFTIVLSFVLSTVVFAQKTDTYIDPLATLDNKEEMLEWVSIEARNYNVSESLILCLINHENKEWNPSLQSYVIQKNGQREDSWGLSQIHLPSHPSITREQAQNPKFAIGFMADELSKGRAWQWSTLKYCK